MSFKKKLDETKMEEIASRMVAIDRSMEAWKSATLGDSGLWFKLARTFVGKGDKAYAKRLKVWFERNRNNLQVKL